MLYWMQPAFKRSTGEGGRKKTKREKETKGIGRNNCRQGRTRLRKRGEEWLVFITVYLGFRL